MTQGPDEDQPRGSTTEHELDAVVEATRTLAGLIAESLSGLDPPVTVPQLRVLVLASHAPQHLGAVAADLGVHPSNATRTCDRLVRAGLLDRRIDPNDRRHIVLTLTTSGRRLVTDVMSHRRAAVERVMVRMSGRDRAMLAESLAAFVAAAGDGGSVR